MTHRLSIAAACSIDPAEPVVGYSVCIVDEAHSSLSYAILEPRLADTAVCRSFVASNDSGDGRVKRQRMPRIVVTTFRNLDLEG